MPEITAADVLRATNPNHPEPIPGDRVELMDLYYRSQRLTTPRDARALSPQILENGDVEMTLTMRFRQTVPDQEATHA